MSRERELLAALVDRYINEDPSADQTPEMQQARAFLAQPSPGLELPPDPPSFPGKAHILPRPKGPRPRPLQQPPTNKGAVMDTDTRPDPQTTEERMREALIWMSGSEDFAPEGKAREGFEKIVLPLLKPE
jgi:hypothetical protein